MQDHPSIHHVHERSYPISSCSLEGDALVVHRPGSPSLSVPISDIRSMFFRVGTRARGSWHDFVIVNAPWRSVKLTSYDAVPGQVVPSRNAYRKFVLKLVKAVRKRSPRVELFVYGEGNAANRFMALVLFVIASLVGGGAVAVLASEGAIGGPLLALCCAAGLFYVASTQLRAAPARPIDPDDEVERMVPPLDADA